MATGAQIIVSELEQAGVSVCFGLPGVHNLALWSALRESSIRLVGVRHEQAAAYAADGYARATGRLAAVLTSTAGGAANASAPLLEAFAANRVEDRNVVDADDAEDALDARGFQTVENELPTRALHAR